MRRSLASIAALGLTALVAACDTEEESPPISDVALVPSPNCSLTAVVSWKTAEAATAAVEFGVAGLEYRIGGSGDATEHEVLVIGMHPETTYMLQALSVTSSGEELRSEMLSFTTGNVPSPFLPLEVDIYDPAAVQVGWTLTNVSSGLIGPVLPVIIDMEGLPVWYHRYNEKELGCADQISEIVDGDHILIGPGVPAGDPVAEIDLQGNVLWTGPAQPEVRLVGHMHHVFTKLTNGHYVVLYFVDDSGPEIGDEVQELDEDGEIVWSWNTFDHLDPHPLRVHSNSLQMDLDQDMMWINSFEQNLTWKVDRSDGQILWTLGEGGDLAPDPDNPTPWFQHAHGLKVLPDGHLLYYDNGSDERGFSRVIEMAIDESAMESTIVWEYPGEEIEDDWFTYSWGDADRLANGNTLVNAGAGPFTPNAVQSRIFEVTTDGTVVWQAWWAMEPERIGSFQAERIPAMATPL